MATRLSAESKLGADYDRLSELHRQTSSAIVQVELQMANNRLASSQLAVAHGKCFSAGDVQLAHEQVAASKQMVALEIDRLATAHE